MTIRIRCILNGFCYKQLGRFPLWENLVFSDWVKFAFRRRRIARLTINSTSSFCKLSVANVSWNPLAKFVGLVQWNKMYIPQVYCLSDQKARP